MVTIGLLVTAAALARRGAFFLPDALLLPGLLVAAAVAARARPPKGSLPVLVAAGGLAGWWALAAAGWGDLRAAAPFLGSVVGLGAAFALGGAAGPAGRSLLHRGLAAMGAVLAAVGLLGYALRLTDMAAGGEGPWRLMTTLSYQNPAGIVLVALGAMAATVPAPVSPPARRAGLTLILIALVATVSRGAALALAVALPFLPRPALVEGLWPAVMAALGGGICLATAGHDGAQPLVILGTLAAVVAAAAGPPTRLRRPTVLAAVLAAAVAGATIVALRTPDVRERGRLDYVEFRLDAWGGAVDQIRERPVTGAGPEEAVTLDDGTTARFVHNDYLQVAAGAGLIGAGLLLVLVGAVARAAGRRDATAAAGVAALVAVAVGGAVDFTWHLPAVGMVTGWAAAMALERGVGQGLTDVRLRTADGEGGTP